MKAPFVHLHLHSEYSIVDSTVRIGQLVERCREQQMPAVGLTDQGNLFGMVFWRFFLVDGEAETPRATVVKLADIRA